MTGSNDIVLLESFYHSRYNADNEARRFDRNAGAAQLYNKNGTPYQIPGYENKEYNVVSYGNKNFSKYTEAYAKREKSTYGHSERLLMKMILDDLLSSHPPRPSDVPWSSQEPYSSDPIEKEYWVLKKLTENAEKYKRYLESKQLIVKMWSERPACKDDSNLCGSGCLSFIQNIFPEGSCFGHILKDYKREDNHTIDGKKSIQNASEDFQKAYLDWETTNKRKRSLDEGTSSSKKRKEKESES